MPNTKDCMNMLQRCNINTYKRSLYIYNIKKVSENLVILVLLGNNSNYLLLLIAPFHFYVGEVFGTNRQHEVYLLYHTSSILCVPDLHRLHLQTCEIALGVCMVYTICRFTSASRPSPKKWNRRWNHFDNS